MTYWLEVEATAFLHIQDNIFSLDLLAVASQDRRPLRGSIQFFVGGDEQNDPVRTDNKGRSSKNELVLEVEPGLKKLFIEAQIIGSDKRAKKFIDVPWPEEETPEKQALRAEKLKIERAKLAKELAGLTKKPSTIETELEKARLRLEVARLGLQTKELEKTPSVLENEVEAAKLRLEVGKLTSQLEELTKKPSTLEQEVTDTKLKAEKAEAEQRIQKAANAPDKELSALEQELEIARLKNQIKEATKEEPPKKAAKIIPHVCGNDGDYLITWEVLADDKTPVKDVIIQISDKKDLDRCRELPPTDDKGTAKISVKFTEAEKKRVITAIVLGSGVSTWINLFY